VDKQDDILTPYKWQKTCQGYLH